MVHVRRNGSIPRLLQVPVRSPQGAVRYQVGNVHFHCNALVAPFGRFRRPTWCHKNKYSLQPFKIACIERYVFTEEGFACRFPLTPCYSAAAASSCELPAWKRTSCRRSRRGWVPCMGVPKSCRPGNLSHLRPQNTCFSYRKWSNLRPSRPG